MLRLDILLLYTPHKCRNTNSARCEYILTSYATWQSVTKEGVKNRSGGGGGGGGRWGEGGDGRGEGKVRTAAMS